MEFSEHFRTCYTIEGMQALPNLHKQIKCIEKINVDASGKWFTKTL